MPTTERLGTLDRFRMIAALMVAAIHTSPLGSINADADFFLTRVLARLAVPFFLMVTGQFALHDEAAARRFLKKTLALYAGAVLLYLPLSIYAGHFQNLTPGKLLKMLLFDGTFYHLWYFPASITGVLLVCALNRIRSKMAATAIAGALYLLGLLGDSYYGLTQSLPGLEAMYQCAFQVFSYTRNGLFMAPLFLLLGRRIDAAKRLPDRRRCLAGAALSLLVMSAEAFWLRNSGMMRHDSMYLLLPLTVSFLYMFLMQIPCSPARRLRELSAWFYLIHPAMIVAVRAAARPLRLTGLLVNNSLVHYLAVCLLSAAAAWGMEALLKQRSKTGRAWIELDLSALEQNVKFLRSNLPRSCRLMPALKANAYGHGAVQVARALRRMGVKAFCVASAGEGVELRRHGIFGEILVLGYTHPEDIPRLRRWGLTQTVVDLEYARKLAAGRRKTRVHVAVDTGMHRLGIPCQDVNALREVFRMKNLRIRGIFTHLCVSDANDERSRAYTRAQAQAFDRALKELRKAGITCPKRHLLASYGVLHYPEYAGNYARAGIALYGVLSDAESTRQYAEELRPVLSLKARVASVRTLHSGESAGYGLACTADREMRTAVLAIGYADGLPRNLSEGKGCVLLHGAKAPIIGRICMDQTLVDVSGIPQVQQGDIAVLLGESGQERLTAADWTQAGGTIANEILSRLGPRLERVVR